MKGRKVNCWAVVMAGGGGTRLWPLSREACPKQFLRLQAVLAAGAEPDSASLLQSAARRAECLAGSPERVLVLTQQRYADLARAQLPDLPPRNLVLEPVGRNTAPCLALAARIIQQRDPAAVMAVLPADHLFRDEQPWLQAMQRAAAFAARQPYLVTLGIPPRSPSSLYGYLQVGDCLEDEVYQVQAFIEKPAPEQAQSLIRTGSVLWNTGAFAWQVGVFLQALEQVLPEVAHGLQDLSEAALEARYPQFPNISVDYGVMEKAPNVAVVKADFERIDLGALESLAEIWPPDAGGSYASDRSNVSAGNTCQPAVRSALVAEDSTGNLVAADLGAEASHPAEARLPIVVLLGVHNLAVVRTGNVLLVCPRDRLGEVPEVMAVLRQRGLGEYL